MNLTKPLFLVPRARVLHGANRLAETNRNTHGSECTASTKVVKKCMQTGQATNQPYSLFSAAATIEQCALAAQLLMIGLDGSAYASAATKGRRSLGTGMKTSDLDAQGLHQRGRQLAGQAMRSNNADCGKRRITTTQSSTSPSASKASTPARPRVIALTLR